MADIGNEKSGLIKSQVASGLDYWSRFSESQKTKYEGKLAAQESAYKKKFGYVAGSWCCAPMDEQKSGAPRSAHFRLSAA